MGEGAGGGDVLGDLELLVRSRYGLIHLDTGEEDRARALLHHLADRLGVPFFTWTRTRGLRRAGLSDSVYDTRRLEQAIAHVAHAAADGVFHFQGVDADEVS
ncbi:MAG: hypothetical protein RQ751_11755, partial [Longimicrobiales bacterium]|nr:hypothetical protein [Longimicrobiales bacterium]